MVNLFIDNNLYGDIEQLKLKLQNISEGSDAYLDILENGRNGVLTEWLNEHNEPLLAERINNISQDLGDTEYMNLLCNVFNGETVNFKKTPIDNCISIHTKLDSMKDGYCRINLSLTILQSINEKYIITIVAGEQNKDIELIPSSYEVGEIIKYEFPSPYSEIVNFRIFVDGNPLHLNIIDKVDIPLENSKLTMVYVQGTDSLADFYISETPITIQQYKDLFPKEDPKVASWLEYYEEFEKREYENFTIASAFTVQNVINFINNIKHSITFSLPSRKQWLHLVDRYYYSVKWCVDSKYCGVCKYKAIEWEMMSDNSYNIYCLLGIAYNNDGERIIQGNNFEASNIRDNIAFRLVCSADDITKIKNK